MKTSDALEKAVNAERHPYQVWKATTAVEAHQKLEALQPRLAWKPLEVIKKTIENMCRLSLNQRNQPTLL